MKELDLNLMVVFVIFGVVTFLVYLNIISGFVAAMILLILAGYGLLSSVVEIYKEARGIRRSKKEK